jgi:hypothetical protein
MKAGFVFTTVLLIGAILLTGCTLFEEPFSTPGQITPDPASSPKQINSNSSSTTATTPTPTTQQPTNEPSTGTIQVLVTDAPANISEVNVKVTEVEVHKAGVDGKPGMWITLNIANEGQPFNLLDLQGGLTMLLAEGNKVESGKYTQLRMTVFSVIVKTDDGPEDGYQAKVPNDNLKFVRTFTLEEGETICLIVDIDANKSIVFTGSTKDYESTKGYEGNVIFKPVVKLSIDREGKWEKLLKRVTPSALPPNTDTNY